MPYLCGQCRRTTKATKRVKHRKKGRKKGKRKHAKHKRKGGCRVAGVAIPKKQCACVRREMKGTRGDLETRKKMTHNVLAHCKHGDYD